MPDKFKLIRADSESSFEKAVNNALDKGYVLRGQIEYRQYYKYNQVLVKPEVKKSAVYCGPM